MKKGLTAGFFVRVIIGIVLLVMLYTLIIDPSLKAFSSRLDQPSHAVFNRLVDLAKDKDVGGPERRSYQMKEGYVIMAFDHEKVKNDPSFEYVANSVPQCKEGNCLCLCLESCQVIYKCEVFWSDDFKTYNKPLLIGLGKPAFYTITIERTQGKRLINIAPG